MNFLEDFVGPFLKYSLMLYGIFFVVIVLAVITR
jgi:hypothetical protein